MDWGSVVVAGALVAAIYYLMTRLGICRGASGQGGCCGDQTADGNREFGQSNRQDNNTTAMARDPVCGIDVAPNSAASSADFNGKTYYFCSVHCRELFQAAPTQYIANEPLTLVDHDE